MTRLSLFNHEKRLKLLEQLLESRVWYLVAVVWLWAAVIGLGFVIKTGNFP